MFKKIYNWLFHACIHKWVIIDKKNIVPNGKHVGTSYHLQCEKCGNISVKDHYV